MCQCGNTCFNTFCWPSIPQIELFTIRSSFSSSSSNNLLLDINFFQKTLRIEQKNFFIFFNSLFFYFRDVSRNILCGRNFFFPLKYYNWAKSRFIFKEIWGTNISFLINKKLLLRILLIKIVWEIKVIFKQIMTKKFCFE